MGGPGRDLEAVPKNLASPPEGVADRAAGSASSLESFCVQPGPGPAREGQCPALHTGASAHLRAAAPGHSEAKLFYLTSAAPLPLVVYALDLAPRSFVAETDTRGNYVFPRPDRSSAPLGFHHSRSFSRGSICPQRRSESRGAAGAGG